MGEPGELLPLHVLELMTHFRQQLSQGFNTQLDQYLVGVAQDAGFIDLQHVIQEHSEVGKVLLYQSVDGGEEEFERDSEPVLELLLLDGLGLGGVGNLLEGGAQDAL